MKLERLLSDVNLSSLVFPEGGSTANLTFLNMIDGRSAGSLACSGIVMFVYQTVPGSALPLYIGEVNRAWVRSDEAAGLLQRLRYGYKGPSLNETPGFYYVSIDGQLTVEILCTEVQYLP